MPTHPRIAFPGLRAAAAALAAALSACALEPPPPAPALPQPTLTPVAFHHSVSFAGGSADLTPTAVADLRSFVVSLPAGRTLAATLVAYAGTGNFPHDPRLAERRAAAVADILGKSGIAASAIPATGRVGTDSELDVIVRTDEVILPGCPNWSREPGYDPGNLPLSNLGCATAFNLGLMVADPADLATRRPLGPADGTQAAEAVVRYRTNKVEQLKVETVQ